MDHPPFETLPGLAGLTSIRHGFFSAAGGVSTGIYSGLNVGVGSRDDPAAVAENRRRVCQAISASEMVSSYQVHGRAVARVTQAWPDNARPKADAMVTDRLGIALCILTADCVPVLFADRRRGVIGAAHAGWKGALAGVCEATLEAMAGLGSRPGDVMAAIGPAIQQSSYEVGPDLAETFLADDPGNRAFFSQGKGDRLQFDLTGYVHRRLARAGLGHIEQVRADTCASEDYFSNRRRTRRGEPDYGRNASVIAISLR